MKKVWIINFIGLLMCMRGMAVPWNMELQSITRSAGHYYDLTIDRGILYVACKLGIEIYSLDDPEHPDRIGTVYTDGLANGVEVRFPYMYVGDVYGFSVWDISDPVDVQYLGGFTRQFEEGYQERLVYRDGYVYVAAYSNGLQIIDVSDPEHPAIIAQQKTSGYAWELAIKKNAVFIMDFFSMSIMDITHKDAPLVKTHFDALFALDIAIQDDFAYLGYVDGLMVLDIRDPFNPVIVSDIGPTGGGTAEAIAIEDHYAFVGHNTYVEIYDISIPLHPIQISFFTPPGHPRKLIVDGNFLYTVLDENGFLVTNITDPTHPVVVDHVNPSIWGTREDVLIDGNELYLCDWDHGLVIYDISDTNILSEIGAFDTPGSLNDIFISADRAYLSCYTELQIVDIANPAQPQYLGSYRSSGNPWSVTVNGNTAYLCDLYSFQILDITDPGHVERIGAIFLAKEGNPYGAVVVADLAYVANGWKGLNIIDIRNPGSPVLAATWPADDSRSYIKISEYHGNLYALNPGDGVDILDISQPLRPTLIKTVRISESQIADFRIRDRKLFLATTTNGIWVVDIRDPENPIPVGGAYTPGNALGVDADEHRVYVADQYDLAVFKSLTYKPDRTPPTITITEPLEMDWVEGKTACIRGIASDSESGIHYIEISTNEGQTWQKAKGQENWSCLITGTTSGIKSIQARSIDWSGNMSLQPDRTIFTFAVKRPQILMAGFMNSQPTSGRQSEIIFGAVVRDPYSLDYLDRIELFLDGEPSGRLLELKGVSNEYAYFELKWIETFDDPEQIQYFLVVFDIFGNLSMVWPTIECW